MVGNWSEEEKAKLEGHSNHTEAAGWAISEGLGIINDPIVQQWARDNKIEHLLNRLMEAGYNTIKVLAELDDEDLEYLKITAPPDRKKLRLASADLKLDLRRQREREEHFSSLRLHPPLSQTPLPHPPMTPQHYTTQQTFPYPPSSPLHPSLIPSMCPQPEQASSSCVPPPHPQPPSKKDKGNSDILEVKPSRMPRRCLLCHCYNSKPSEHDSQCAKTCSSLKSCPTSWKERHPEEAKALRDQERKERSELKRKEQYQRSIMQKAVQELLKIKPLPVFDSYVREHLETHHPADRSAMMDKLAEEFKIARDQAKAEQVVNRKIKRELKELSPDDPLGYIKRRKMELFAPKQRDAIFSAVASEDQNSPDEEREELTTDRW